MSLIAALGASLILACFAYPLKFYVCWFTWTIRWFFLLNFVYLAAGTLAGGMSGWLAAEWSGAQPTEIEWVNGILYGIVGALAIRADFGSVSNPGLSSSGPSSAKPRNERGEINYARATRSALAVVLRWAGEGLDGRARDEMRNWLTTLEDEKLIRAAFSIKAVLMNLELPGTTATLLNKAVDQTVLTLRGATQATRDEPRTRLIEFCAKHLLEQHVTRKSAIAMLNDPGLASTG